MLPTVVIHDRDQAKAALEAAGLAGQDIQLRSAPAAAGYAGVGYLKALGDTIGHELLIDCDDQPGIVMAALRVGCRKLVFSGSQKLFVKLDAMARELQAVIWHETALPRGLLQLDPDLDGPGAKHVVGVWLRRTMEDGADLP